MTYVKTYLKSEIAVDSIVTIHYFEYMKNFVFNGESHDFWEFLYVDYGAVSVTSNDKIFELNTGDIIFHKPNEYHAIRSTGETAPNLIAVSFSSFSPSMRFFENRADTLKKEEKELLSLLIIEAEETFSTPINVPSVEKVEIKPDTPFASQQMIRLYLEIFLITFYRNHIYPNVKSLFVPLHKSSPEKESLKDLRFEKITEFLELHICKHISVSDISDKLSISRSAFHLLSHEKTNCGVMDYFNKMKIRRAKEMIRTGSMNFTELSYFLSYSSLSHFSKQFKKITGMSPLEYSNSIKEITENLKHKDRY